MLYTEENRFYVPYMTEGESVLWQGRPEPGRLMLGSDAYLIVFGLFWSVFASAMGYVLLRDYSLVAGLCCLPPVLFGLYLLVGCYFHRAWLWKRTYYVITNKKLLRMQAGRVDVVPGEKMPRLYISRRRDGSGSIHLGRARHHSKGFRRLAAGDSGLFSLVNISDVDRVRNLLAQISSK